MLRTAALLALLPLAAHAAPLDLHYAAYAAGLNVLQIDAKMDVTSWRYRIDLEYRTTGTFGFLLPSRIATSAEGAFQAGRALPERMLSAGTLRGQPRRTELDYQDAIPVVRQLLPPNDSERDPVPAELQRNTVDTLSAMAQLVRQVNASARCEGALRTFDGRRLSELRAWTIGQEQLAPNSRSTYAGPALHCAFEGRQLAGFAHDESRDSLARPQSGNAWFAALTPGGPIVPVRISFHTHWFGDATAFLTTRE